MDVVSDHRLHAPSGMAKINFAKLPFNEAIGFLRGKVSLPTASYKELQAGMHARAFVIAGAMKSELLADMRASIDKALAEGKTLADFRKDFDLAVQNHGWSYNGSRGWRSAVIFNTNLRVAYSAGNEAQMQAAKVRRPYARYLAGLSAEPRPEHLVWHNTVLPIDHPGWDTHTPPNDWGCKCRKVSVSQREVDRDGLKVLERGPESGARRILNPATGKMENVPNGIGPGWNYNPGQAAWGKKLSEQAFTQWSAQGARAWERLTPGDWRSNGLSESVPAKPARGKPDFSIPRTREGMQTAIEKSLGAPEKTFSFEGDGFRYDLNVNAGLLAQHIDPARAQFIPLVKETLEDPQEVWQSFERHRGTGKVVLRQRIIRVVRTEKKEGMLVVTNTNNGKMEAWTMVPTSDLKYLTRQRNGQLIYKKR